MESLLKPGEFVEVGSEEWKAHIAMEKQRARETIKKLREEINILNLYLINMEKI